MSTEPTPPVKELPSGCAMLFALPFLAAGDYIMAISLGILPSDPDSFKAPRLVVTAAGAVFAMGGLMVLLKGSFSAGAQQLPAYQWLEFIIVTLFLVAFGAIFLWVGFGPGERAFQTETSIGPVTTSGEGNPILGRCLFGTFGLGTLIGGLFYAYRKLMTLPMGDDEDEGME